MSDDDPLLHANVKSLALIAVFTLTLLSGQAPGVRAERAPDPEPTPVPEPTITPRPTTTPTVIPKPTPTSTPTPVVLRARLPTATPTPDSMTEVAADYALNLVVPWGAAVEHFMDGEPTVYLFETEDLGIALILAVMANESGGRMEIVSSAGACGLMQVIPKNWFPENAHELCESPFANIRAGMRILQGAIDIAQERNEDLFYGLAYYNCSFAGVHSDGCGPTGGLNYADHIIGFWLPRVETRLAECAAKWGWNFYWQGVDHYGCNH